MADLALGAPAGAELAGRFFVVGAAPSFFLLASFRPGSFPRVLRIVASQFSKPALPFEGMGLPTHRQRRTGKREREREGETERERERERERVREKRERERDTDDTEV